MLALKPYTVGFLSEVPTYVTESLMFQGAREAADRLGVNMVYFTPLIDEGEALHYASMDEELKRHIRQKHKKLKAYLESFHLDGLIFIGWARDFEGELGRDLREYLHPMKLISIGKDFPDTPSVVMDGGPYIGQLARHLAEQHHRRHIAYVHPWAEDARVDYYSEVMKDHHLYDERLIVRSSELIEYNTVPARMRHALHLLLDERKMPLDAIMVMSAFEGKFMLDELHRRGIRVPEDIALVCYENSPAIEFSKPAITTVYYPYVELGAAACDMLIRQLEGEDVPNVEVIQTRIMYRDSCGCTVNKIKPIEATLPAITDEVMLAPIQIAAHMHLEFPMPPVDYSRIGQAFLASLESGDGTFLTTFGEEMGKVSNWRESGLQGMIDQFRELLLPGYASDPQLYKRAEEMWMAARYIVKDYETATTLSRYLRYEEQSRIINKLNQHLLTARAVPELREILTGYLNWLRIPTLYLLLQGDTLHPKYQNHLLLAYNEYNETTGSQMAKGLKAEFATFVSMQSKSYQLMAMPLTAGDEQIGVAWVDPGIHDANLIVAIIGLISNAIKSALLMEESRALVEQLYGEIALRREKETQLAFYADMDYLTHLLNRRNFYEMLQLFAKEGRSFAVLYIDVDGFKHVNDTFGHDAGDQLLIQISDLLREVLSPIVFQSVRLTVSDLDEVGQNPLPGTIFRIGGDEFTALLPATFAEDVADYAERLVEAFHRRFPLSVGEVQVSGSIGIALYPTDTQDTEQLLKFADLALYKAKETKDNYLFFKHI